MSSAAGFPCRENFLPPPSPGFTSSPIPMATTESNARLLSSGPFDFDPTWMTTAWRTQRPSDGKRWCALL